MSTRATYQFDSDTRNPVTVYIHHDGYPEGAACYFLNACEQPGAHGGMLEAFIRGNDRASVTDSHSRHGDTEYRYTLSPDHVLTAQHRPWNGDSWKQFFNGPLAEFIEQEKGEKLLRTTDGYLDTNAAMAKLCQKLESVQDWLARGATGNASGTAGDAWRLLRMIEKRYGKTASTETAREAFDVSDRFFVKAYGWAASQGISDAEALALWKNRMREED